uniref:DUF985 domain-containing protein n=1 Tax=Plectus sambesii TaxID=2011161 RepID=A0A914X9L6_9BILA
MLRQAHRQLQICARIRLARLCTMSQSKDKWADIVKRLGMTRHPNENGFMSAILYDSPHQISNPPAGQPLNSGNIVQFLFEEGNFSPWHRMRHSDEIWMHQSGGTMQVHMITNGQYSSKSFGPSDTLVVPADTWYAAVVDKGADYCLYAELVTPGFLPDNCEFGSVDLLNALNITDELKTYLSSLLPSTSHS